MVYHCTEHELAVRMIPNTKHFRMRTNGKVVQGEQRYLETSGLSVGFTKAASKLFTHLFTTWCLIFLAMSILELNIIIILQARTGKTAFNRRHPKIARCYTLWYRLKAVYAVAEDLWRAPICANGL